jgi:hypothetical protein
MKIPYVAAEEVVSLILNGELDRSTMIVDVRGDHAGDGDVLGRRIRGSINIPKFDKTKVFKPI